MQYLLAWLPFLLASGDWASGDVKPCYLHIHIRTNCIKTYKLASMPTL